MTKHTIVNKNDEVIEYKSRLEMEEDDFYRVSCLWIFNTKGDILLSRRALSKKHDPGKWEGAVAGTVEEGETYLTNIIKETKEEIGLSITEYDISEKQKLFLDQAKWKFFCQLYTYIWNGAISDLTIEEKEVMDVRWFGREELDTFLKEKPELFVNNFETILHSLT